MKKNKIFRALFAICSLTAGLAIFAPAANAAYTCQNGEACFYENQYSRGSVFRTAGLAREGYTVYDFGQERFTSGASANDAVSSIVNKTSLYLFVFKDSLKGGDYFTVKPGETVTGLTAVTVFHRVGANKSLWTDSIDENISSVLSQKSQWYLG